MLSVLKVNAPPALRLNALTKDYPGVRAVDHVSFEIQPNTVHCLVGENGAGKSTLWTNTQLNGINMLTGFINATA